MAITIVSPPASSPQTSATDTSSSGAAATGGDSAAGQNFLDLLLAQLVPVVLQPQGTPSVPEDTAETKTDAGLTDTAALDVSADDASALLNALGFIPAGVKTDAASTPVADSTLSGTTPSEAKAANTPAISFPAANDDTAKVESVITGTVPADDGKTAKFAVTHNTVASTSEISTARSNADAPAAASMPLQNQPLVATAAHQPQTVREAPLSIPTPVRDQNWSADFGQKIVWLAANDKQAAQLTLNPPHMGPIEVSISVDKGNASASFVSANADVRQAIESALPRLREMLASSGIELGQTNVGAESFRQPEGNANGQGGTPRSFLDNAILASTQGGLLPSRTSETQQGNGLVDIFA